MIRFDYILLGIMLIIILLFIALIIIEKIRHRQRMMFLEAKYSAKMRQS